MEPSLWKSIAPLSISQLIYGNISQEIAILREAIGPLDDSRLDNSKCMSMSIYKAHTMLKIHEIHGNNIAITLCVVLVNAWIHSLNVCSVQYLMNLQKEFKIVKKILENHLCNFLCFLCRADRGCSLTGSYMLLLLTLDISTLRLIVQSFW